MKKERKTIVVKQHNTRIKRDYNIKIESPLSYAQEIEKNINKEKMELYKNE